MKEISAAERIWTFLILAFAMVGFLVELNRSLGLIILYAVIIGIVVYLYKYPPDWLIRMSRYPYRQTSASMAKKKKRKNPFHVIEGKKKRSL